MRVILAVVLISLGLPGCTPYIPVKDDFSTNALVKTGDTAPEFAEFNNYNASVNPLLADQICATPYEPLQERSLGAAPGTIIEARGRCRTHVPLLGE
ncbi:MAG: hypothetical protein JO001_23885 [Alphaproteobacteria bacterium]|nr:hypothetical protein [Alphaproteobacteria bacterium]